MFWLKLGYLHGSVKRENNVKSTFHLEVCQFFGDRWGKGL